MGRKAHKQNWQAADRKGDLEMEKPGRLRGENKRAMNPLPEKGSPENRGRFCAFWSKTQTRGTKETTILAASNFNFPAPLF